MWTIIKALLLLTTIVSGIYFIFTLINEMQELGGQYHTLNAIIYVIMLLPQNLNIVLPVIGFLGTLLGLNQLARHNELIAMRAAGMSLKKISVGVFLAALLVMIISFCLGGFIGPVLEKKAEINKAMNKGNQVFLITPRSTWVKNGDDYILIGNSLPDGRLANIKRFHINHNQLTEITKANIAVFEGDHWRLENVIDTHITPSKITQKHLSAIDLSSLASPKLLKVLVSAPDQLSLLSLYQYIHYRLINHLEAKRYQIQFWSILYNPLTIVLLMLITVPFIFTGSGRDQTSYKIIFGMLLCFAFFIIQRFIMPFATVYNITPALGAAIPCLLFGSFFLILLFCLD